MEILTTRTDCLYRVHNEICQKLCETRMLPRPRDSRNISLVTLLYAYLCGLQRVRPMKMDPKRSCSCRQSYKTGSVRGGRVKCGRGVAVNHISGAPCWASELRGQWPVAKEGGREREGPHSFRREETRRGGQTFRSFPTNWSSSSKRPGHERSRS